MSATHVTAAPPYDEDAPRRPSPLSARVWAGAVLLLAGVGLTGLCGCFMIGAVVIANPAFFAPSPPSPPPAPTWDAANVFLFTTLLVLALACLISAGVLAVVGFLGLFRILFGERSRPEAQATERGGRGDPAPTAGAWPPGATL